MDHKPLPELSHRLNRLAADMTAFASARGADGRPWSARRAAREIGCSLSTVRSLMNHHFSLGEAASRSAIPSATSSSSAEVKPMAISTPPSTEKTIEAGDNGQVATHSSPAAPVATTRKDHAFLRTMLLNVATLLLMVVLSLISIQSLTQTSADPAITPMILIVSTQLLIGISLFL